MLYDELEYAELESDPLYSVSCAMSDLQWVVYAAIGAVVIAAALGMAVVWRLRRG